jgi:hypothetical protein
MAPKTEAADKLYQRIMQMQDQAFAAGRYEVAYHLMAAAMHAAEELNRVDLLENLEALAMTRQSEIDKTAPAHAISSASAHGRRNSALFANLATTAAAARGRLAADSVVRRMRDRTTRAD